MSEQLAKKVTSRKSTAIDFHDKISTEWSSGYLRRSFNRRLSLFSAILERNVEKDKRWLDLGCGSGILTKELLDRHAIVTAIDGSSGMLNEARKIDVVNAILKPTFIQADAHELSIIADSAFEGVLCSSVLEYVDSPNKVIQEIARVLGSGGILILSVPPKLSFIRTIQKILRWIASVVGKKDKLAYLSISRFEIPPNQLLPWLDGMGFDVCHVTKYDPILPNVLLNVLRPALLIAEARKR